jgi:predicted CXXCH cytochrome family protein
MRLPILVALALALAAAGPVKAEDAAPAPVTAQDCLACHGDPDLSITLGSGETQSLHVDAGAYAHSVHGSALNCTACHPGFTTEQPHPPVNTASRASFRAAFRDACKTCHLDNDRKAHDGVHYKLLAGGDTRAPFCADCHTAHAIEPPARPRSRISQTCGQCHAPVVAAYRESVHGRALTDGNPDVPACTDCHRAHDIKDPRQRAWLLETPQMCGQCHADRKLAAKYGMSDKVLQTYLADFHGMTASLHEGKNTGSTRFTALCIDCHGVHDIKRVKDPDSRVIRANLVKTCQACHAGAGPTFPAAWLSHYEPSPKKAPLVYAVKVFYLAFIPFVIGGLVLQVGLNLWRFWVGR